MGAVVIYLSQAYYDRTHRRSVGEWLGDTGVAIGTWTLVLVGVVAAVLPIWV